CRRRHESPYSVASPPCAAGDKRSECGAPRQTAEDLTMAAEVPPQLFASTTRGIKLAIGRCGEKGWVRSSMTGAFVRGAAVLGVALIRGHLGWWRESASCVPWRNGPNGIGEPWAYG